MLVQQDVLGLEVAVDHVHLLEVSHGFQDLGEDLAGIFLLQSALVLAPDELVE